MLCDCIFPDLSNIRRRYSSNPADSQKEGSVSSMQASRMDNDFSGSRTREHASLLISCASFLFSLPPLQNLNNKPGGIGMLRVCVLFTVFPTQSVANSKNSNFASVGLVPLAVRTVVWVKKSLVRCGGWVRLSVQDRRWCGWLRVAAVQIGLDGWGIQ